MKIVKFLIENGVDLDNSRASYFEGHSFLIRALSKQNFEMVRLLLGNGADVNTKDEYSNETPLHIAVKKNNLKIVKYLIDNGAELEEVDNNGYTAFLIALKYDFVEIYKFLVEAKANVNVVLKNGESTITVLYNMNNNVNENNVESLKYLIKNGLNIRYLFNANEKIKQLIFDRVNIEVQAKKPSLFYKYCKILFDNGLDINMKIVEEGFERDLLAKAFSSGDIYEAKRINLTALAKMLNFLMDNGIELNNNKDVLKSMYKIFLMEELDFMEIELFTLKKTFHKELFENSEWKNILIKMFNKGVLIQEVLFKHLYPIIYNIATTSSSTNFKIERKEDLEYLKTQIEKNKNLI